MVQNVSSLDRIDPIHQYYDRMPKVYLQSIKYFECILDGRCTFFITVKLWSRTQNCRFGCVCIAVFNCFLSHN